MIKLEPINERVGVPSGCGLGGLVHNPQIAQISLSRNQAACRSEICRSDERTLRSLPRNDHPTGIENKTPAISKLTPTALRVLRSTRLASNNPKPVPMTNRVLLIMPISGRVKGISLMVSSSEVLYFDCFTTLSLHAPDHHHRQCSSEG